MQKNHEQERAEDKMILQRWQEERQVEAIKELAESSKDLKTSSHHSINKDKGDDLCM